jgi:hypothetical protein
MADITKKVHNLVPGNQRSQSFTQADAGAGDVIMVAESLGKPAHKVLFDADQALSFRLNVYHEIFPRRTGDQVINIWDECDVNLTSGIRYQDASMAEIFIDAGSTFELDNDVPVNDIEMVTVSGNYTVIVM